MSIKNIQPNRTVVADNAMRVKVIKNRPISYLGVFLFASIALCSGKASALTMSDLSTGYGNCSYSETETVATFNLTIYFKEAAGHLGVKATFTSRGVMLFTYDDKGVPQNDFVNVVASSMTLNGIPYFTTATTPGRYSMYHGIRTTSEWNKSSAMTANITITVLKSKIASWPAVGVQAGNFTSSGDVAEVNGLAYIGPSSTGNCSVFLNPELPPPAITPKVTMTAPDWDLGELPRGEETTVVLPATKDQLCFSYEGSTAIANQKYLINATNTNGLSADSRYLLKSLEDSSQTVPYTLTLANSTDTVLLPNTQNRLFSLDTGGRTCFTPTFKAQPNKAVKGGAYSDILTFTVVAKS